MGLLNRISLQHRITLLIGLTVTVTVGVFVYLGASAVDDTEETAQREQLTSTAQAVAGHVDDVLTRTRGREEHLAQMVANAWSQGEPQLTNLLNSYPRLLFESDLYLLQPQGQLVWSMRPGVTIPGGLSAEPLVTQSLESLRSTIGSCAASTTQDRSRACFASPVLLADDEPAGILLAQIDLGRPDLDLFSLEQLNESFRLELVAADGLILAANGPAASDTSAHTEAVATLSSEGNTGEAVHRPTGEDEESSHRFGYTPISTVSGWGVVVEPRNPTTLTVAGDASQRLLLFGLAALAAALAVAWLGAAQLLKPLRALGTKATQTAAGDLSTPMATVGRDEVGELAMALDSLRVSLRTALADGQEVRRQGAARGRLLDGLFARQEEERKRIAHELHEDTMQSLFGLALILDSLGDQVVAAEQITRNQVTRVSVLASALIDDLRRLATDLRPPILDMFGLVPALRSYAESRLSEKGVQPRFNAYDVEPRLPPLLEIGLYRVAQEAIDNVTAHARAKTASITIKREGQLVILAIEDDGDGFDAAEVLADPDAARRLGILSMRERIALLGGTFRIESAPGQGTQVRAEVPLSSSQEDGSGPLR